MRPKPEVCHGYPVEIRDTEILVDIHFYYLSGYPATREDPGSPGEVEIVNITYASGAKSEQEEEYLMPMIVAMLHHEDDDFLRLVEEYVWEHIQDEEDKVAEAMHAQWKEDRDDAMFEAETDRHLEGDK